MKNQEWLIVGASVAGKSHTDAEPQIPCQDSHEISCLPGNWGVAVVCDGAGSAKHADLGANFVAKLTAKLFAEIIEKNNWHLHTHLPTSKKWETCVVNTLLEVRHRLEKYAEEITVSSKELACTVIVVIFSPLGLLVAHIGDGRAGYCNAQNQWLPLLKPWKGEEANQTVFITSNIWEQPDSFIETGVVVQPPIAFTLMSDGCEAHAFQTGIFDHEQQKYVEINLPHPPFFDPLVATLHNLYGQQLPSNNIQQKWTNFVENGNIGLANEPDDKTLLLGVLITR